MVEGLRRVGRLDLEVERVLVPVLLDGHEDAVDLSVPQQPDVEAVVGAAIELADAPRVADVTWILESAGRFFLSHRRALACLVIDTARWRT
jgi:hypothetical protein